MSQRRRMHAVSHADPISAPPPLSPANARRVPRTRTGAAWVGLTTAALIALALIVFLAQNTRTTEIAFLWMTARTSLAVALLVAAVGSALIILILGTARITQLRRLARHPQRLDAGQPAPHTFQEEKPL
jgi:uncharacterized integral membrane protein